MHVCMRACVLPIKIAPAVQKLGFFTSIFLTHFFLKIQFLHHDMLHTVNGNMLHTVNGDHLFRALLVHGRGGGLDLAWHEGFRH